MVIHIKLKKLNSKTSKNTLPLERGVRGVIQSKKQTRDIQSCQLKSMLLLSKNKVLLLERSSGLSTISFLFYTKRNNKIV